MEGNEFCPNCRLEWALPAMTFDEYLVRVMIALDQHPEWRVGQTYFNVLYRVRIQLANEHIRGKPGIDPFYDDRIIPAFLAEVYKRW